MNYQKYILEVYSGYYPYSRDYEKYILFDDNNNCIIHTNSKYELRIKMSLYGIASDRFKLYHCQRTFSGRIIYAQFEFL